MHGSKPPRSWILLEPSSRPGDEDGWVAMRRFVKALGRQYHITLIDIRPERSAAVPPADTTTPGGQDSVDEKIRTAGEAPHIRGHKYEPSDSKPTANKLPQTASQTPPKLHR